MDKPRIYLAFLLLLSLSVSGFAQRRPSGRAGAKNADLVITGGTVVTMDGTHRIIENGGIAIQGDQIIAVGTAAEMEKGYHGAPIINAAGKAVIPGLINTHTHAAMSLFRGISDDLDLNDWLTKFIFPAEAKNVTEQFVRAGTRLGLA